VDLRLRNLAQLDARAVPLPHGTEVVTRVDRIVGERRVPQGSVGRVSRTDTEHPGRFVLIGMSRALRVLFVVSAEAGERVRLISARKASPTQRKMYENGP
jgi:uncharacterized DUF497 family protein